MQFKRYGGGDSAFLCLHGWNGNHATFAPLAAGLPEGVSLWCPDLPQFDSLDAITSELQHFASGIGKPLRIIGNCSGALHGLLLAKRIPVERLVMIDAFAYWPTYFRMFLTPIAGRIAYLTAFANPLGRWLANTAVAQHRAASTDLTEGFRRVNHAATYRQLQLLAEMDAPESFRGLVHEVEIVFGQHSFGAVRRSAQIWQSVFPAAKQYELTGAGHLPILEATRQLQSILFQERRCTV